MNDSILTLADMRLMGTEEPMTPEAALFMNMPPLLDCGKGLDRTVFMRRVMSIAREYIVDHDLVRSAARAGIPWDLVQYLERDPTFITAVDMIKRELTPEEVTTKAEVMEMLKREATTAAKARDRITAMKELARIAGYTMGEDGGASGKGSAPVINIHLNGNPVGMPMINVTPAAPTQPKPMLRVTSHGEELL